MKITHSKVLCEGRYHKIEARGSKLITAGHQIHGKIYTQAGYPGGRCGEVLACWNASLAQGTLVGRMPRKLQDHLIELLIEQTPNHYLARIHQGGYIRKGRLNLVVFELRIFGKELGYTSYFAKRGSSPRVYFSGAYTSCPAWLAVLSRAINHAHPVTWKEIEAIDEIIPRTSGIVKWNEYGYMAERVDELMIKLRAQK